MCRSTVFAMEGHPADDEFKGNSSARDGICGVARGVEMGCGRLRSNETWIKPPNQNTRRARTFICLPSGCSSKYTLHMYLRLVNDQ